MEPEAPAEKPCWFSFGGTAARRLQVESAFLFHSTIFGVHCASSWLVSGNYDEPKYICCFCLLAEVYLLFLWDPLFCTGRWTSPFEAADAARRVAKLLVSHQLLQLKGVPN